MRACPAHVRAHAGCMCRPRQGALEVWEYSAEHLRRYAPLLVGRDVRLRHVPFTWFPLVRAQHLHPRCLPRHACNGAAATHLTPPCVHPKMERLSVCMHHTCTYQHRRLDTCNEGRACQLHEMGLYHA